jgi:transposase
MKHDGRKLDHKTLEEIRRMAVERVREGESPSAVIASYGFCRTTIYKWLQAVEGKRRDLDALRSRIGTGRPRKLTKSQGQRVFRWINGKDPRQYGFDFGLWTRKVVAELISDKFDVELSLASVGKLLAEVGLTPQKPLKRAIPIRALRQRPNASARRSTSGMNRGFVRTRCRAERGA